MWSAFICSVEQEKTRYSLTPLSSLDQCLPPSTSQGGGCKIFFARYRPRDILEHRLYKQRGKMYPHELKQETIDTWSKYKPDAAENQILPCLQKLFVHSADLKKLPTKTHNYVTYGEKEWDRSQPRQT